MPTSYHGRRHSDRKNSHMPTNDIYMRTMACPTKSSKTEAASSPRNSGRRSWRSSASTPNYPQHSTRRLTVRPNGSIKHWKNTCAATSTINKTIGSSSSQSPNSHTIARNTPLRSTRRFSRIMDSNPRRSSSREASPAMRKKPTSTIHDSASYTKNSRRTSSLSRHERNTTTTSDTSKNPTLKREIGYTS